MRRLLSLLVLLLAPGLGAQALTPRPDLLLSVPALAARLGEPGLVVLQVDRDATAWREGHIAGARLLPLGAIVVSRDGIPNELPPVATLHSVLKSAGVSSDSRIVIVGDPLGAARLFFTLDYLGLGGQAAILDGGQAAWRAAGLPLTTDTAAVTPGRLEPRVQAGVLMEKDELARRLGDTTLVLLDARPAPEYRGEVAGAGVARPGHLPGARSFFWHLALASADPPLLKDPAVLAKLLGREGVAEGREMVTYCRTGVQASYLYFVLRVLGYQPRLYDGSFLEWSQDAGLPVAR